MNHFVLRKRDYCCGICIAENAPATAITAAGELVRCLGATSACVPVIRYGTPKKGEICLGANSTSCETEELVITVKDDILWIDGGKRGILYGVYELLERLGYRFFAEDCEVFPSAEELTMPADTYIQDKPWFEYRCAFWYDANAKNAPRFRFNDTCGEKVRIPDLWGGGMVYEGFAHTLGELAELESNNGNYTGIQACMTDEKTFQTVVKNLRAKLEANPRATIASVSQNDSGGEDRGCTCPSCAAIDEREGSQMGSLLTFVNRVAEELEPDYPELAIDTLAYRYTRKAPDHLCARDNVIVRLCDIECCFSHPLDECNQTTDCVAAADDSTFINTLRKWSKHCNRIYIWDYTTNFRSYQYPYPNFNALRGNARFFADHNVRGLFEQGNYEGKNGEFGALRMYLISKLAWNPYLSEEEYQRHIDEFMAAYYGPGSAHIRRYFDRLQESAKDVHFGIYYNDPTKFFVDPDTEGTQEERAAAFLKKGREDFAAAIEGASDVQKMHIKRSAIQLDLYEYYVHFNKWDALDENDPAKKDAEDAVRTAAANMYGHILSYDISHIYEHKNILNELPHFLEPPAIK